MSNVKLSQARNKSMAFTRWKESLARREILGMKLRLVHYNQEVEAIKVQEQLLRTYFT